MTISKGKRNTMFYPTLNIISYGFLKQLYIRCECC